MFGRINPLTGQVEPIERLANTGVPGQATFTPWQGSGQVPDSNAQVLRPIEHLVEPGVPGQGQATFTPWLGSGSPTGLQPTGGDPLTDSEIAPSPMMLPPQQFMQGLGRQNQGVPGQGNGVAWGDLPFNRGFGSSIFGVQQGAGGRANDAMERLQAGETSNSWSGRGPLRGLGALPPTSPPGAMLRAFREAASSGELSRQLALGEKDRRMLAVDNAAADRTTPNRPGGVGDPYRRSQSVFRSGGAM